MYDTDAREGHMAERAWKIRDQMADGSWGPEYEVTLEQYKAKVKADSAKAMAAFRAAAKE